ncbi:Concanavalin A-like lectin/glucanase, subgroup [Artemisia annua]|uniref:Concanavalin A-like lectin/glucanase, subgroup n=1 Tax=Artemisia annua TaxID=35608 RepID=A0A2U1KPG9_ARTAN|nr:Concanavalin A-like lectin/glucanase, subgroup [Artemisia annua]
MSTFSLSFFSLILMFFTITITAQPYNATDHFLLDCGSSTADQQWVIDERTKFVPSNFTTTSFTSTPNNQDPSVPQTPYSTARIMNTSSFTYRFPVSEGPKFLRLYFYPATYSGLTPNQSFFSVSSNGYSLLTNFSAFLTALFLAEKRSDAGGDGPPVPYFVKEFLIYVKDSQFLHVVFTPSPNSYAFINGIEIVSLPENLYVNAKEPKGVDMNTAAVINKDTALEMVYRLNMGGRQISGNDDTGMYRVWDQDDNYVSGYKGFTPTYANPITYTVETPSYTAPEPVYQTQREMGNQSDLYNLTWILPVDSGYFYMLRLHFCNIISLYTKPRQTIFTVFINNKTAEEEADLFQWTKGTGYPIYKDYVVFVNSPDGRKTKQDLWLALHPSPSFNLYMDAYLNGLEVFKMSMGRDLAAPNPELSFTTPVATPTLPAKGKKTPYIAIIGGVGGGLVLLSILVLIVLRQRRRVKHYGTADDRSSYGPAYSESKSTKSYHSTLPSDRCRRFLLTDVKAATNEFSDDCVIGHGGFGKVYKGYIDDVTTAVAIKRLNPSSSQGVYEFHTEIGLLSKLRHVQLVSLIGYCDDEGEMILVYDYMAHGTLREHLYRTSNPPLSWKTRLDICIGAAKEQVSLAEWGKLSYRKGTLNKIVDPKLRGAIAPECLRQFGIVAISCLKEQGSERPAMDEVVWGLEFALELQQAAEKTVVEVVNATDHFLLDCGSSTADQQWVIDERTKFVPSNFTTTSFTSTPNNQDPSVPQTPYSTARIMNTSSFTYRFPVSEGPKFLRLYFYPATYSGLTPNQSFFSVSSNGYSLLTNFSAFLTALFLAEKRSDAGGDGPPVPYFVKEFLIYVKDSQFLHVVFTPSPNSYAFINGIEIVSLPENLYVNAKEPKGVDMNTAAVINKDTALEMVYRLNMGGRQISGNDDTGMYRVWDQDDNYVSGYKGFTPTYANPITYTVETPSYTAPEPVYQTQREMGNQSDLYNLTWILPVDSGYFYMLRLHFCNIISLYTKPRQTIFTVFINNKTAEEEADLFQWTKGTGYPIYKDYVVFVNSPDGRKTKQDLWLALHPSPSFNLYMDAYLNGLEVFKMSMGRDLAAPNPELSFTTPVATPTLPAKGKKTPYIAIIGGVGGGLVLLSILVLIVLRQRRRVKHYGTADDRSSYGPAYSESKSTKSYHSTLPSDRCRRFLLTDVKAATNEFSDDCVIGHGGFGKVYKGYIDDVTTAVAIKRLNPSSSQGVYEFHTEIGLLSKLRHVQLVSLIGYCDDEGEMILVYDYMAHGTLREHLYRTSNPPLSWKTRLDICIGAAKEQVSLAEWGKLSYRKGTLNKIVDPKLRGAIAPECLRQFGIVAISCLKEQGSERPAMDEVVWGLEFALELQQAAEKTVVEVVPDNQEHPFLLQGEQTTTDDDIFSGSTAIRNGTSSISDSTEGFKSDTVFSEMQKKTGR